MELELGLKITHTRDDLTSTTDLRVTKDPSGPLFVSKEIDTMFILVGHLNGFRRENIDIDINEYGNRIAISGKKPVQEMVLIGWIMHKNEAVMRTFRKIFRIPEDVILDKIKAKFNDVTSTLTIRMPKLVKGISGVGIEEVEEEEVDRRRLEPTETVVEKVPESESPKGEVPQESKQPPKIEKIDQVETQLQEVVADEVPEKSRNSEANKEQTREQKVKGMEDSGQVVEQAIDQAKKIPEKDDSKERVKEKPEEPNEETESRKPERVSEPVCKESKEPEVKSREENDQVEEKPQGRPEIELQATTQKTEFPTGSETSSTEPKEEAEGETDHPGTVEQPPTEETQTKEIPEERASEKGLEEHVHVPESIQLTKSIDDQVTGEQEYPSSSSTQVDEKHEKPEELQKQESCTEGDQQLTEPEPYQEPKADDQTIKEEVHEKDQTQADGIKETPTHEENLSQEKVDELELQKVEKQESSSEEAAQGKKPAPRKSKVYTPIVVAGSAFVVSIIVLVIHFIRAKKR
ncbi:hypothetical protein ACOSQ4_009697 [Xanthoceras sorbifolium]